jgi:uncharacterized protein YndB with AHSA1/START domain
VFTVTQQIVVPAPLEETWRNLAEPERVSRWFADATDWEPDGIFRLDFGDGDFFSGRVLDWEPPVFLRLEWKFMGVGPAFEIRVSLFPVEGGTEVTVQDRGARTVEEAEGLREGWDDFLSRLDRLVREGGRTRYEWSQTIASTALVDDACPGLLSVLREPGYWRESFPDEGVEVAPDGEAAVRLRFRHSGVSGARTEAWLRVDPAEGGGRLVGVVHEGWPDLPEPMRIPERRRFAGLWARALYRIEHE